MEEKENKQEEPKVDNTAEKDKVKKTKIKKNKTKEQDIVKVDLSKKPEEQKDNITKVDLSKKPEENKVKEDSTKEEEVVAESKDADATQETPVLEEITDDAKEEVSEIEEKVEEAIVEAKNTGEPLPKNIQKLVDFMETTGGDINDYVKLNKDYSKVDDTTVLNEYYKQTKPHLNNEEIKFLIDDSFSYDEEIDEETDIKRKKLALKEQVANARAHLDGQKSKYYREIQAGSKLTKEQQKAVDFFNRYNKESAATKQAAKLNSDIFTQKTDKVFDDKFKGFEYNVGDKKYRFNVKNAEEVKATQSDLNNFTKKFLDKKMALKDAMGYHKSLYTAMNPDAVAKHFYEQGKADAMKDSIAKSKNVDMNPRQAHGEIKNSGLKFKVLGDNANDFKFKIKNRK